MAGASDNLFPSGDESILSGGIADTEKLFKIINGNNGLGMTVKLGKQLRDLTAEIKKNLLAARGETDSKLGMGQMPKFDDGLPRSLKLIGGAMSVGSLGMAMMPDTNSAVTQRIAADSFAGISGINARQAIIRSNKAVGGGATSAMGPTMAAMGLFAGGGYTATSKTFRNVMGQVGGLSALTGGTNEQMTAGLAGINAMRFLRIGVQVRDSNGNLKPPNQIINDTYRFLYGGRKITPEQAAMVLNPGSKGYATISQIAGGDQNLMSIIQMGIIARAKNNGKAISAKDLSGSSRALDLLGVGKESPIRSNFNYQTSEARKLQATEKGLVGGFNAALDTTTAVNNGFSRLAEEADLLTQAFAGLRGFMQTMPGAGNTGATLSSIGGGAVSFGMEAMQLLMLKRMIGGGGAAGAANTAAKGGLSKLFAGASGFLGKAGKFGKFAGPVLGALLSGVSGYQDQKAGKGFLGEFLKSAAIGGGAGAIFGGLPGALIGALVGGGGYALGRGAGALFGQGGDGGCNHGNAGCTHGMGGDNTAQMGFSGGNKASDGLVLQMPVPRGTQITSGYGPRDNSKNPQISSWHRGLDYGVKVGTKVTAAADGVVEEAGLHRQYGNYVIINHGAKSTLYGHLSKILVRKGESVHAGQVIGLSGGKKGAPGAGTSTGPHLHFEVRNKGGVAAQGRENPKNWFGRVISTISNLFSKITGRNRNNGTSKSSTAMPADYGLNFSRNSNLSTLPLSEALSSSLMSGEPIDFDSLKKEFPSGQLAKGIRGTKDGVFINSKFDRVSGDNVGMAGGSRAGLIKMLYASGFRGKALETAFAVALAESGGRANAENKSSKDYGLFQINMAGDLKKDRLSKSWRKSTGERFRLNSIRDLYNPKTNANVAYHMTKGGSNWSRWVTFQEGTFAKYLDDAQTAAKDAGIGGDNSQAGMALATEGTRTHAVSGGQMSMTSRHATVNVYVDMQVKLASLSKFELQRAAGELRSAVDRELRVKGIGTV